MSVKIPTIIRGQRTAWITDQPQHWLTMENYSYTFHWELRGLSSLDLKSTRKKEWCNEYKDYFSFDETVIEADVSLSLPLGTYEWCCYAISDQTGDRCFYGNQKVAVVDG